MEPGKWIRTLREQRMVKPSDVERVSRAVADQKRHSDFYVSHSTLADIETGSTPSIHKLFSLAICLRVPLQELLLPFGIDADEVPAYQPALASTAVTRNQAALGAQAFRFQLNFDTNLASEETTMLHLSSQELQALPVFFQARNDPFRYRFVVIGSQDDGMADLLPPRSLVEVDTEQNTVQVFPWRTLRERPVYLVWHSGGHSCRWCQVDGRELTLLPHPQSSHIVRRFRMPTDATVVGRVTNAWLPFDAAPKNNC